MAVEKVYNWYFQNFSSYNSDGSYSTSSYRAVPDEVQKFAYASISLSNCTLGGIAEAYAGVFGSIMGYWIEGATLPTPWDEPSLKAADVSSVIYGYGATNAQGTVHMLILGSEEPL
jgi:hypothetical protein